MGRFASDEGSGGFTAAPAGTHVARCIRIIDIGTDEDEYQGKTRTRNRIVVFWELPSELVETKDGQMPAIASRFYTNSLNEKSTLFGDLSSWLGRELSGEETKHFDLMTLLDKPCMLTVSTTAAGKSKVTAVIGLPKQLVCPPRVHPLVSFWLDEFDPNVFANLSEGMKKLVMGSDEYLSRSGASAASASASASSPTSSARAAPATPATPAIPATPTAPATAKEARLAAWSAFKRRFPAMDALLMAETYRQKATSYFPGKPSELITVTEWQQFVKDGFARAELPDPLDSETQFKEDDIPF